MPPAAYFGVHGRDFLRVDAVNGHVGARREGSYPQVWLFLLLWLVVVILLLLGSQRLLALSMQAIRGSTENHQKQHAVCHW
jgi:hypothetical protein